MDGVLLIDKPAGITSAGVVRVLKRRAGRRKVGHLGTLDPFATGLLPLCVGEGTKIAQFLASEDKVYTGRVRLGVETDSLDCTGRTVREAPSPALERAELERVAARFAGRSWQVPPMYSAIKREGVPLYELARRGIEVERAARPIDIREIRLTIGGPEEIDFRVECSKGTYVRVLAADIARALGSVGHLVNLRRERFGRFQVSEAHPLAALAEETGPLPVLDIRTALSHLRELRIREEAAILLRRGQQGVLRALPAPRDRGDMALLIADSGQAVGVVEAESGRLQWRLVRALAPQPNEDTKLYKPQPVC